MTTPLVQHLLQRIRAEGPISFHDFMEAALYHPLWGYYSSERNPIGREGDFYTSSDVDPLFGRMLARRFGAMASEIGISPESFTIVELGAGRGLLARDILAEFPFPYRIVERSPAMRQRQKTLLGAGSGVQWLEDLPPGITGCVFSNEFFDALPVHRMVRRQGVLREIFVDEEFHEIEAVPRQTLDLPLLEGQFAEINVAAPSWVRKVGKSLARGFHLALDYGYLDREFYARPNGTLMCYWRHQISENPYERIGEQDITAHINFSDLMRAGHDSGLELMEFSTQMDFLIRNGILNDMETMAHAGTAEAMQRLQAVKKLILPGSMGERFKVLIQRKLT